jgi:predicted aconitase with swiveling domain
MKGEVIVAGEGSGEVLRLTRPISFWGGVDPKDGRVTDPRHPQAGQSMTGRVVVIDRLIGSSSGSSVLLELVARGAGPAALILGEVDAITALGAIVAREMGHAATPVIQLDSSLFAGLPERCRVTPEGSILAV